MNPRVIAVFVPRRPRIAEIGHKCATCRRYDWNRQTCPATMKSVPRRTAMSVVCGHYVECPHCQ